MFKIKGGELWRHFLVNIISLDSFGLKVNFHLSAQLDILARSILSCRAVSAGSSPLSTRVVSSANINISLSISLKITLIYILDNNGPNLDFWTPSRIVWGVLYKPIVKWLSHLLGRLLAFLIRYHFIYSGQGAFHEQLSHRLLIKMVGLILDRNYFYQFWDHFFNILLKYGQHAKYQESDQFQKGYWTVLKVNMITELISFAKIYLRYHNGKYGTF